MNAFSVAISLKRQVNIDPNGGVQLATWRADERASSVAFYASVVRNTWPYTPPLTVIWTDRGGVGSERIVYWKPEIFTTLRRVVNNTLYLHIKSFVRVLTYHDRQG